MGSPNSTLRGWASSAPFASVTIRSETTHCHCLFECDNWHSVGHLHNENEVHGENTRDSEGDDIVLPRTGAASAR